MKAKNTGRPRSTAPKADAPVDTNAAQDVTPAPAFSQSAPRPPFTTAAAEAAYRSLVRRAVEGLPDWISSVPRPVFPGDPSEAAAARLGFGYAVRMPEHYAEAVESTASGIRDALDGLAALAEDGPLAFFLDRVVGFSPSAWERAVGVGFAPDESRLPVPAGHWRQHRCAITGVAFAAPPGAPVPSLYFDRVTLDAEGHEADPEAHASPEDRNPHAYALHPALVCAGPEAVLAAVWDAVYERLYTAADKIVDALTLASLVSGMEPADLDTEQAARALTTRKDGARVPAGWAYAGGL